MKKLTITISLILIFALAVPALGADHGSFTDVPDDHWAYDAINSLVAAGVVEGYPDGEYKGQESMTRYEMAVMVSRALDNIAEEQEAMAEGLTEGQAEDVTAIVESLMERNMPESLTDQQAEEVADIVEALTYELREELAVLGADVEVLAEDLEALEARVDDMDVPEDNIEFSATVDTMFEVADYPDADDEIAAAMVLWADGDALDLDLPINAEGDPVDGTSSESDLENYVDNLLTTDSDDWDGIEDADDLPSEKRFWQEYNFNVYGNVGDANFLLDVDAISNVFTEEKSAFGYEESDDLDFEMDTATLYFEYEDIYMRAGDFEDEHLAPYYVDEEDLQGVEVAKDYLDIDWNFLVAGFGDEVTDDIYGVTASSDMDFGTLAGSFYQTRLDHDQLNVLSVALSDVAVTDAVTLGGEVVFTDSTEGEDLYEEDDFLVALDGEFAATEDLTVNARFETVGEDFNQYKGDLEEDRDYDLFNIGAAFDLDENNTLSGSYTFVQIGDELQADDDYNDEDKHTIEARIDNAYGDFANYAMVEYTMNDNYTDDYDTRVIELGTEYAWDDATTLGAALVNKNEENDDANVINYNYLKGHMNRELSENTAWNVEAKWIDGEVGEDDVEAESSSLTTSLTVSF
ncbi:S-layer homology domain-containing protein [Halanaerobium hydrogeniformans]|uniref:S-layer domain-containing protein n=1 Tax=Halanaerobium hydrogeniformans TaxID=656519 RepID=E4RJM7_HALHG|nr:S-layer homology domain-containing protein [Halanaerobium hydrogeniformans]ADQ15447.1 S-layer domain-containing protein [Halanaerobium hydrogeniformans]